MLDTSKTRIVENQKDHRRQQLIVATIKTISEFGISNTTVAKVTKAANLSAGIVGFYFNGKEQLLLETLKALSEEFTSNIKAAFASTETPQDKLHAVLDVYFQPEICNIEKIAVWWAFCSESSARKDYLKICGDFDAWFHKSLLDEVRKLCGEFKNPESGAIAISRGLEGMIDGFWQEFLYQPDEFDPNEARKICHDYLTTIFPDTFQGLSTNKMNLTHSPTDTSTKTTCGYLPVWTYYDDEFLSLEKENLFRKNWLLVGHVNDIPNPRDFLTLDAIGERAVVIRGNDNKIRAFHNVCRHRGAKLVDSMNGQCAHALSCPFHGWTYQLDGKLIGVPAENTFKNLDKSKNGLVPLDMEIWMGFVFVRFSKEGATLQKSMKPLEHIFEAYDIENMLPLEGTNYDVVLPYNWKVIHDIDNEGYHVPVGHPSLQQLYGKSYVDTDIDGIPLSTATINDKPGKLWSVKNYQKLLPNFEHLPQEYQRMWQYGTIFPSMVIGLYPDSIEYYMTIPLTTNTTVLRGGSYALPDSRREMKAVRYLTQRINNTTSDEDKKYVQWLQDGMHSSVFPEPNLSSIEQGVSDFHHQIQGILPVAKLKNHPGSGQVEAVNASISEN